MSVRVRYITGSDRCPGHSVRAVAILVPLERRKTPTRSLKIRFNLDSYCLLR